MSNEAVSQDAGHTEREDSRRPGDDAAAEPRWLSESELQVWRALTLLIARLPSALESQLQRDSGLSFVEYYVLAGLSDAPQRTMRMSQLAMFTYSELSRLSHVMTRLERRGLVRREPDPTDGRCTNAILTDEGYELLVAAAPRHVTTARELVVDALDSDQLQELGRISERIVASIDGRLERETIAREA
ncbi:MarR family winged helix-turn-helix transcriptional regulator [Microlunatus sp. Gsoil 973]|jgi:DNA-binding MarR family transcriptional regulator|uniref:MarR family winged helix-turn-helix transcriptional regulator n=1 Tax=Microlunatus sp. Gsoil 973 TaxID=2672569 RepID=UPI0012B4A9F1|nr:MarR family transcriptional regulator [Microlunatus sp. Gsoil 973]QGN33739.1 MarR family transcriptional regulator [Microlunatus sp. Gsoil 973]